jgi:cysteine desulfurase/selenocysteine lyase
MVEKAVDVRTLRQDFPMLSKTMHGKPLLYLDTAATAQKPQVVIDTIRDFYQEKYGTVHRAVYELSLHSTQEYQRIRQKIQAFLNAAKPAEIIYTRGTTESINMVAYCFGKAFVKPGDEILISEMEHHSNIVPWQLLCEDRGAILKVIPFNERGELIQEKYAELLNERTKLVALTYVSNALGTVNPVKEMIQQAHAVGAKVLIDAAQAAPHIPIDVQDLDADFLVFSGHKIYGPTGIGILYGKEELLNALPPYQGGGDMIDTVAFDKTTYHSLPLKFEAGTPMIAEVMGLGAAIDYVSSIGLPAIQQWEHALLAEATKQMLEVPGLRIIGTAANKGAIISFAIDGIHALDIGTMLDLKGIAVRTGHHCAQPALRHFGVDGTARASFGLYNDFEEIPRFVQALQDIVRLFK